LLDYLKKQFKCPKCGRVFLTERGLKIHLAAHRNRELIEKIRKERAEQFVEVRVKMSRELFERWDKALRKREMQIEPLIAIMIHKYLGSVDPETILNNLDLQKEEIEYFV